MVYKKLTVGNTKDTESVKGAVVSFRLAPTYITYLMNPYASFATATYPLWDSTIWDFGATDHVTNNVNNLLPGTFRPCKPEPFFVGD